jgi:DNA-binding CsgD family transcriptional regulator
MMEGWTMTTFEPIFETYVHFDPSTTGQYFVGEPIRTEDLIPYGEFKETRFYKERVQPQRLVDFATVVLDKSTTTAALFGIFRHERHGLVDDAMRERMRFVAPHLRRAVLVNQVIDLKTASASAIADTLDGLRSAVVLVAARGTIVHCNSRGHAMLASGDALGAIDGRLVATDRDANQELEQLLAPAAKGDSVLGIRGISLSLAGHRSGKRYVAHVMPLTSGARRRTGASYPAAVALFVHKATLETPAAPEVIARAFRLTPTELRALLAIVQIDGVVETAEALGIFENTLKTHLRRLFDKTGTSRQADLVKLVAGFQTPLATQ